MQLDASTGERRSKHEAGTFKLCLAVGTYFPCSRKENCEETGATVAVLICAFILVHIRVGWPVATI